MRVLVFGASGMLGHKLYQVLAARYDVFATVRGEFDSTARFAIFDERSIIPRTRVSDPASVRAAIEMIRPDVVINAVGIIKQVAGSKDVIKILTANSLFPRRLADLSAEFGFRLLTISTDCVFDGKRGNYSEDDEPNACDLYGMSKLLGEIGEKSLTIRTSLIGRELASSHSIVEWFLSNRGKAVTGFTNAIYTGFPTIVLAEIIGDILSNHASLCGIYHVSSEPISKFDLLVLLNEAYNAGVSIDRDDEVVIDRSLDSSTFRAATGYHPPSWNEMVRKMADDPTPYDEWRR